MMTGLDAIVGDDRHLLVVEIFTSYQGEGANTGRPVTFIRLAGCNLRCPWCDTDLSQSRPMSLREIIQEVSARRCRSVILTGGEPTIHWNELQGLIVLLRKKAGVAWVGLETNGVTAPIGSPEFGEDAKLDYIACSPKFEFADRYVPENMVRRAGEVRIVASSSAVPDIADFCQRMRTLIAAGRYYISPCERDGNMDLDTAYALLGRLNASLAHDMVPWCLSVQVHKLIGLR